MYRWVLVSTHEDRDHATAVKDAQIITDYGFGGQLTSLSLDRVRYTPKSVILMVYCLLNVKYFSAVNTMLGSV